MKNHTIRICALAMMLAIIATAVPVSAATTILKPPSYSPVPACYPCPDSADPVWTLSTVLFVTTAITTAVFHV